MPTTLEDIARALNVSKMTVSRAITNHPEISKETRDRILRMARKMNYRPNQFARALSTSHSYLIGIVVPDLMHSYFAEICRGVEAKARPAGYQNLICSTDEEFQKEVDEIEALLSRTDGLIVASAVSSSDKRFYRRLVSEGARVVFIDRAVEGVRCSSVTTDDFIVGKLATEHLISLGHRKVGHLRGTDVSTSIKRMEGYVQALSDAGIRMNRNLIRDCGYAESEGYEAMTQWIEDGGFPSAIFVANDAAAIGAISALQSSGRRVPEDVAIVGAGNIHYGDMLSVPLTTVGWSTSEMGQTAARLLLELINNKNSKREQVLLEPQLVVRQSCGAAKTRKASG